MAFAKILESDRFGQILLHKDTDDEGNPKIIIKIEVDDMYVSSGISHKEEEVIDGAFESLDLEQIEEFLTQTLPF